jgi:circadian clock protein KaiC
MEFLVSGAKDFDEPGVFMSFEEKDTDLVENFSSLGFDLDGLVAHDKLALDYVHIERSEILETGEFDLEGLSSGSVLPLIPSGPNESSWIRSKPFFRAFQMRAFSGRRSGDFSGG